MADPKVHPAAAVFPMLSDDELADLAEDIKANGLLHPIVLDAEGVLIDGRNRLAACKLAGIEPSFITYDGDDDAVVDFILSLNVLRRHLTEGQRALAVVRAQCFKLKQKEIDQRALASENGVTHGRVGQAAVIVEHAPELADAVMAKTMPFSGAYQEARAIKDAKEHRETSAAADAAKLEQVRTADRDLYLLVSEGRLSLADAVGVLEKREAEQREARRRDVGYMVNATMMLTSLLQRPSSDILDAWTSGVSPHQTEGPFKDSIWRPDGLRDLARKLAELGDELERREDGQGGEKRLA